MISTKPKPRYQLIAEDIRSRIKSGALRPGEAMPSYRTLMRQHGVTIGTVRQAIQSLQSEQLVETQPRIGCVVAEKKPVWRKVGLTFVGQFGEVDAYVMETLHDEFARLKCDVTVHVAPRITDETLPALVEWAKRQDGVVTRGWVTVRAIEEMSAAGVRLVQCGEPVDGPAPADVNCVTVSLDNVMQMAVGHLVGLGHRRVTLCSFADTRYYQLIGRLFLECCREHGVEGHAHVLVRDAVDMCGPFLDWLNAQGTPPTALLVENPRNATMLIERLTANGWPVPGRISVMATAGVGRVTGNTEGLTCVLTATREMFLRAVEMLSASMDDRAAFARREMIAPKLIPGRTCRPLP